MRAAPDPRALRPGWSGAFTTRPRVPPTGFPPVSRLPARTPPRHPPPAGIPARGALRLGPSGRCPVRFPSGVPPGLPSRAVLMLAPPPDGSAGEGPGRPGPRSPVPACCATPSPGSRGRTARQPGSGPVPAAPRPGAAGEAGMRTATGITRPPAHLALAASSALSAAESDGSAWPLGSPDGGAGPREVDVRYLRGTWQVGQCHQFRARSPLAGCARAEVMLAGLRRSGGSADMVPGGTDGARNRSLSRTVTMASCWCLPRGRLRSAGCPGSRGR
jgi:hypothetical protein